MRIAFGDLTYDHGFKCEPSYAPEVNDRIWVVCNAAITGAWLCFPVAEMIRRLECHPTTLPRASTAFLFHVPVTWHYRLGIAIVTEKVGEEFRSALLVCLPCCR